MLYSGVIMIIEILKILVFYVFVITCGVGLTRLSAQFASPNRRLLLIALLGIGSIILIKVLGITADPLSRAMFHGSLFMLMLSAVIYSLISWYEMVRGALNPWIKSVAYLGVFAIIAGIIAYAHNAGAEALATTAIVFQVGFVFALIAHAVVTYLRIRNFTDMMNQ
jgi:drug/metabolite transporter (DMT)-like permease